MAKEPRPDESQAEIAIRGWAGWLKSLLIVPPILLGLAVLVWQISARDLPRHAPPEEAARSVRVIEVEPVAFVPRAIGFGFVEPGKIWHGVAQVSGRIVRRHPGLERGNILEAGTELLRIDPTDYELAVARAEANLASAQAQLDELAVEQSNLETSLEIEQRALALQQRELKRQKDLAAKGTSSQAKADQAESALLTQRQRLQEVENQIRLLPTRRGVLEASLKLREAELDENRVNLARTLITLPFTAKIAEIQAEESQFVASGEKLVVADSVDLAEVAVQVPLERMRPLVPSGLDLTGITDRELAGITEKVGLAARLRLPLEGFTAGWDGRFERISDSIDPKTRTLGVIVVVDEPYRQAIPGKRPPLTKNMFVEVELAAPARDGTIVVPRVALHERNASGPAVYLLGPDQRLEIRAVVAGSRQGDLVVIDEGLSPGDKVIISDLVPAVAGMLLTPDLDQAAMARLRAQAEATGALR